MNRLLIISIYTSFILHSFSYAGNSSTTTTIQINLPQIEKSKEEGFLIKTFKDGGPFMWPLLFCSVLALAIIMERIWFFKKFNTDVEDFTKKIIKLYKNKGIKEAQELCIKNKERIAIARIYLACLSKYNEGWDRAEKEIEIQANIEIGTMERGMSSLGAIANISPLLGFLGTVTGMIASFKSIALADEVSAKLVSGGIHQALITTATGLIIAIPVFAFHSIFVSRIDKFALDIEKNSREFLRTIFERKENAT